MSELDPRVVKQKIKALRLLDLQTVTESDLSMMLEELCNGYRVMTRHLSVPYFFRARLLTKIERYQHIKDLWHPPARALKKFGRANPPGEPMLYLSDTELTALLELRPQVGDRVTILKCVPRFAGAQVHVQEIAIPELTSPHYPHNPAIASRLEDAPAQFGSSRRRDTNLLIRQFLVEQFTRIVDVEQDHEYKLSSMISQFLLDATFIDGLLYPSIATEDRGMNLALKPEAGRRLIKPDSCCTVEIIEKTRTFGYKFQPVEESQIIQPSGEIEWL